MRILIINGHVSSMFGSQAFQEFEMLVKRNFCSFEQIFTKQKLLIDTETQYYIRTNDDLDDFLYEKESSYVKVEAAQMFDNLDMIFLSGDANLCPWSPKAQKILVLLRMSLKTKKLMFAYSFGMLALVYLAASNLEKTINVLNSKNFGTKLHDLAYYTQNKQNLKLNDYYLNNITGDLYQYNYDSDEWIPKCNVGLHYKKAAEESRSLGKFMLKTPTYRIKSRAEIDNISVSKSIGAICTPMKRHIQHFIFKDLPNQFLVPQHNKWDIHPFIFTNPNKAFIVLAEYDSGPMIIEFFETIVATMFSITHKYPETMKVLQNFIYKKLMEFQTSQHSAVTRRIEIYDSIYKAKFMNRNNTFQGGSNQNSVQDHVQNAQRIKVMNLMENQNKKQNKSVNQDNILQMEEFKHPGYSDNKLQNLQNPTFHLQKNYTFGHRKQSILNVQSHRDQISVSQENNKNQSVTTENTAETSQKIQSKSILKIHSNKKLKIQWTLPDDSNTSIINQNNQSSQIMSNSEVFNKKQIRQFLHPNISQNALFNDEITSSRSQNNQCQIKSITIQQIQKKLNSTTNSLKNYLGKAIQPRDSLKIESYESLDEPSMKNLGEKSNSVPYINFAPTISKIAEKILGSKSFITFRGNKQFEKYQQYIPNINTQSEYKPITQYKFRTENSDKWIGPQFKKQ